MSNFCPSLVYCFFFTLTFLSHFNQKTRETRPTSITIVSSLHLKKSFREINKILSMVIHRHTHRLPHTIGICCGARPSVKHSHNITIQVLCAHFPLICSVLRRIGVIVLKKSFWRLLRQFNTLFFQQHLSQHCGREFAIHPECLYSHLLHFKR